MTQRARNATAKRPYGSLELTPDSQKLLGELLFTLAKIEQRIELKRQYLATNENFEPYMAFMRLDRD